MSLKFDPKGSHSQLAVQLYKYAHVKLLEGYERDCVLVPRSVRRPGCCALLGIYEMCCSQLILFFIGVPYFCDSLGIVVGSKLNFADFFFFFFVKRGSYLSCERWFYFGIE